MKLKLLILLLLPVMVNAQEVRPVISADYLALITTDSFNLNKNKIIDSSNSIDKTLLRYKAYNYSGGFTVKKITIEPDNTVKLHAATTKYLYIGGSVTATAEMQHINHVPKVQNNYVQGRSLNGSLIWQGAETNEVLSYGPSINTLEFDGVNYPYDVNGQLVTAGTGNGIKATAYNNSIFRTATLYSTAATLQTKYRKNYEQQLSSTFKAGQSSTNTFITANKNKAFNFSALLEGNIKRFTVGGSYNCRQENFSNTNRNGFLNRAYQNALLTPVSFYNKQGNTIGSAQRRYSKKADNPFYLLQNNNHYFLQQQQTGNLILEQKLKQLKIKLSQSYETLQQQSSEGYQPGTAFFENGTAVNRTSSDANYLLQANAQYNIPFNNYKFRAQVITNYIYSNNKSQIKYTPADAVYNYNRSSHNGSITFSPTYRADYFEAGLNVVNKFYTSNTTVKNNFFLPAVAAFSRFEKLFNVNNLTAKITTGFSRFNSELALSSSFAPNSLVKYTVANALQYLPVTEVNTFNNLLPIEHKEYNAGIELTYKSKIALSVDWFSRHTLNDVFAIENTGRLQLENIASHRNRGVEVELNLYPYLWDSRKIFLSNTISFVAYRSKVTAVKNGYNFTPIAGFNDVHKAIVKDEPLGVIVGNTFLKDAANNIIIGTDGFPLVNNTPAVIGNPTPDFTIKASNRINWKQWDFNIDWEWKKGGDVWNGTQALLDYYGRSENSAVLRNTTNYVFNGVDANGKVNTIPVSFYNASLPVEQNRWVRYGPGSVAEAYIQKGDCVRINNIGLSYKPKIKKYLQQLAFTVYASNIMLWSAYKGADPNQLLYDQAGTTGLDFFNLPSYRSVGFTASLKF
jgi:hypothetical protein